MARRLKTLILLLALIALPLRGLAAVALCECAQDQHAAIAVSMEQTSDHDASHDSADGHSHDGAGHAGEHGPAGHDAAGHGGSGDHKSGPAASGCSACAACCIGGAVAASAWSSFSFAPIGASRIPFLEHRVTGVVPAQLERPPLAQIA